MAQESRCASGEPPILDSGGPVVAHIWTSNRGITRKMLRILLAHFWASSGPVPDDAGEGAGEGGRILKRLTRWRLNFRKSYIFSR